MENLHRRFLHTQALTDDRKWVSWTASTVRPPCQQSGATTWMWHFWVVSLKFHAAQRLLIEVSHQLCINKRQQIRNKEKINKQAVIRHTDQDLCQCLTASTVAVMRTSSLLRSLVLLQQLWYQHTTSACQNTFHITDTHSHFTALASDIAAYAHTTLVVQLGGSVVWWSGRWSRNSMVVSSIPSCHD